MQKPKARARVASGHEADPAWRVDGSVTAAQHIHSVDCQIELLALNRQPQREPGIRGVARDLVGPSGIEKPEIAAKLPSDDPVVERRVRIAVIVQQHVVEIVDILEPENQTDTAAAVAA